MKTFMKCTLFSLFMLTGAAFSTLKAQDWEIGGMLSAVNYQGDLSKRHITLGATRPGFGGIARYYFSPRFNVRGSLMMGWISGDDANYDDDRYRPKRNLNFRSHVAELGVMGEINILPYISNSRRFRFAPYVFGGIAVFHFNPKATYDGQTYVLQPLGTEGQGIEGYDRPYSRIQPAIPYGVGIKYSLGNYWNLGIEVGQRKLFTDYLDDVSGTYPDRDQLFAKGGQPAVNASNPSRFIDSKYDVNRAGQNRGNDTKFDMYIFGGITLTKTIRRWGC